MDDTPFGKQRRAVFELALSADPSVIRERGILPSDPTLATVRPEVTNVVFVIHGIRDAGYWTHKIARKAQAMGSRPPRVYSTETSTYGYFPMILFLLPSRRQRKVEWLIDQYVEARSLYPHARFSYVGHSNGTYLLANALKNYRACRFDNIVFAGSVVRRDFDWQILFDRGQVQAVLNYVATADWVVAWFPGALEKTRLQDLGTAGHNGFSQVRQTREKEVTSRPIGSNSVKVFERRYVRGRHDAAIAEENWDDIAHFVTHGEPLPSCPLPVVSRRNPFVVVLGWLAPVVWICIALALWGIAVLIWRQPWPEWQRTASLGAYGWVIWKILTRL